MIIFCSCSGKKDEEVLSMKDISAQSQRNYDSDTITKKPKEVYLIDMEMIDSIFRNLSINGKNEKKMFPERFSPKWTNKLIFLSGSDSLFFNQWSFKDSVQTKNAFYNWIDCFGEKCKSIRLGEETKFQPDNFIMLINDTSINYITSPSRINEKLWLKYFESQGIENWKHFIHQKTSSKAKWFMVEENELIEKKTTL